jgi:hypothetical protein
MADVPEPGFRKYWRQEISWLKSECHATTNRYPEAASVVQQVHKMISDIENLGKCTPARVGEHSQWKTILKSAEQNRKVLQIFRSDVAFQRTLQHVHGIIGGTAGRPESECTGRIK